MSTVVILASCGGDRDPADVTIEQSAIVDSTSFNAPGNIGGGGPYGGPGVSSQGVNQIDVFYRKADQVLWHFSWTGLHWSTPESLGGGTIASDPAAVSWGPGRIDVVALSPGSNAIIHRWFEGGKWSAYESLGGVGGSAPVISSPGRGKLDVFVTGTDNQLWQRSFNGTWSAWIPLGGYLTSDPGAVSSAPGTTFVFARGGGNALWYRVGVNNVWGAWQSLGGVCSSAPAASSPGNGRVDVFVRGGGNAFYHRAFAGNTWTDFENIGGVYASRPAAVSWGAGRIDVFGQADGTMFHQFATRTPFPIPAGSYQQSCINISFDGVSLWAECASPDGFSGTYTSVEYPKCVNPPANIYGDLTCATGAPPPGGSYLATCVGVNTSGTTVSANCRTRSGAWPATSLAFSNCAPGSIWNNDGALTCSTSSSPPPPPPPPPNTCTVSALVMLGTCYNVDGSVSSILPSGISDTGCGATESIAVGNGLFALEASVGCVTSQPTAGCCTYTSQTYQGCYCP